MSLAFVRHYLGRQSAGLEARFIEYFIGAYFGDNTVIRSTIVTFLQLDWSDRLVSSISDCLVTVILIGVIRSRLLITTY